MALIASFLPHTISGELAIPLPFKAPKTYHCPLSSSILVCSSRSYASIVRMPKGFCVSEFLHTIDVELSFCFIHFVFAIFISFLIFFLINRLNIFLSMVEFLIYMPLQMGAPIYEYLLNLYHLV
jgi:hypothetical protein